MRRSTVNRIPPGLFLWLLFNLPKFIRLFIRLFKDPRVPWHLKAVVIGALIYVLSPIDLVPGFLAPVLGQIDDVIILVAAIRYFLKRCPQDVLWEHVRAIEGGT